MPHLVFNPNFFGQDQQNDRPQTVILTLFIGAILSPSSSSFWKKSRALTASAPSTALVPFRSASKRKVRRLTKLSGLVDCHPHGAFVDQFWVMRTGGNLQKKTCNALVYYNWKGNKNPWQPRLLLEDSTVLPTSSVPNIDEFHHPIGIRASYQVLRLWNNLDVNG